MFEQKTKKAKMNQSTNHLKCPQVCATRDTFGIDNQLSQHISTLAYWEGKHVEEVVQDACRAYIKQRIPKAFKKYLKKQVEHYGRTAVEQALTELATT